MGHVMRCLALANMLGNAFDRRFAIIQPEPELRELIEEQGVAVITLPSNTVTDFLDRIDGETVVLLDGYSFDETYQRAVRQRARTLVYIDDLMQGHQVADVVINHAGGVTEANYNAEPDTQYCLGPHYALLRPEFLQAEASAPPADGPIFVNMGGADSYNHSLAVLEAIRQVEPSLPIDLVLGAFHPNRPSVEIYQTQLPNLTIRQGLSAGQMRDALQACSLAITACSTISYEVCALNRPLIGVVTAGNQERLAQFLSDKRLALSVHFPRLLSRLKPSLSLESALKLAIQAYQFSPDTVSETLANQHRYFDGRSPERFRTLFVKLCS